MTGPRSDSRKSPATQGLSTVCRALDVLEAVAENGSPLSVTELARRLRLSKSTAHRLAATLRARGYLRQIPDAATYTVGVKSFEIGASFLHQTNLRSISLPEMERLCEMTQETVHLSTLEGAEVVYIEKVSSPRPYGMSTRVGSRSPAHCTAVGKAILAYLEPDSLDRILLQPLERFTPKTICSLELLVEELARVRQQGIATDFEEIEPNLCCVAATIFNHDRHPVAAIGVAGPTARIVPHIELYRPHVQSAARRISRNLGGR
jgi:DNA-binding IclR family transcriptional regulator